MKQAIAEIESAEASETTGEVEGSAELPKEAPHLRLVRGLEDQGARVTAQSQNSVELEDPAKRVRYTISYVEGPIRKLQFKEIGLARRMTRAVLSPVTNVLVLLARKVHKLETGEDLDLVKYWYDRDGQSLTLIIKLDRCQYLYIAIEKLCLELFDSQDLSRALEGGRNNSMKLRSYPVAAFTSERCCGRCGEIDTVDMMARVFSHN